MRPLRLKSFCVLCLLGLWSSGISYSHEENRALVLVTGVYSNLPKLRQWELKKLFLGVPIIKDNQKLIPLRNVSDRIMYEVFLQNVVHMSADTYENKVIEGPAVSYSDFDQLLRLLVETPNTVSYMWRENARQEPRLRIVQVIWTGRTSKN